ncbi:hypothetical protein KFE25_013584 [Diacronema lutheri]|uniref:Uncharacterized protein n=1 Tax=Diacronema lutheri TaxID=2081491 RepID=A0A8J6CEW0_DIALT|nr:hypothetical protein KFE25_013584 [Diacronema lutheri]
MKELERLLADPAKAPRVLGSAEAFVDALFVGKHVDELLVLRDGLRKLGLAGAMRRDVLSAVERSRTIPEFASRMGARELDALDGRVYYWTPDGRERTLKRDREGNLHRSVREKLCAAAELAHSSAQASHSPSEGAAAGLRATGGLYIAELARRRRRQHPCSPGERSRTLATRDVQDVLPHGAGRFLPCWDRGHAFVGGEGTGSSVHVDQVCWSNVGKNFAGRKAIAIWPTGRETRRVLDLWYRHCLLRPDNGTGELPAEAAAELASASRLAVVEPGDVFVFSGANAHTTIVVPDRTPDCTPGVPGPRSGAARGRTRAPPRRREGLRSTEPPPPPTRASCLSLTAFESFINLNEENLRAFLTTGTPAHDDECAMREDDLIDFKEDVADRMHAALEWVGGAERAVDEGARARARARTPPVPRATRASHSLAGRLRAAVLAAARLLRTNADIDTRMRALEGRARARMSCERTDGCCAPAGQPGQPNAACGLDAPADGTGGAASADGREPFGECGEEGHGDALESARFFLGGDEKGGPWTH